MRLAIVYCRVSTKGQVKAASSIQTQTDICTKFAESHGYAVVEAIAERVSGARLDRPGLGRVRNMAARGELEAVITLDPGRLSRSIAHLVLLTEEFEQNGVELLFATSPNEDTSVGERLLQLRNARSNAKSGEISERTRRILS